MSETSARLEHQSPCLSTYTSRVNIGNALLYGLPTDLQLRGTQLDTALSVFFVTYCVFEIPATLLMKKLRPHIFVGLQQARRLAKCAVDASILFSIRVHVSLRSLRNSAGFRYATCEFAVKPHLLTAKVRNYGGLVTVRFILGIAEAGIFPGCRWHTILSFPPLGQHIQAST